MEENLRSQARPAHGDSFIDELRLLRESRAVSYRELAARITRTREQNGVAPATARIAHTTVSDVFRPGRSRLNAALVAEIVRALGCDEETAEHWRVRAARRTAEASGTRTPAPGPVDQKPFIESPAPRFSSLTVLALLAGGLLLNATGKFFNPLLGDVLFVDMVGTAVVALLAGPWMAAAVGALFVAVELLKFQLGGALFAMTMIFAGLIWGYGVRRGWARTLAHFLGLSAVVAVATSVVAVPITMIYYEGHVDRGLDVVFARLQETGLGPWLAVSAGNLSVSLVDKMLTGVIAFLIARLIWTAPSAAEHGFAPPSR